MTIAHLASERLVLFYEVSVSRNSALNYVEEIVTDTLF